VRLAKDRNTDTLYAVKVIQRSLKQHKFGGGGGGGEDYAALRVGGSPKLVCLKVRRVFTVVTTLQVHFTDCPPVQRACSVGRAWLLESERSDHARARLLPGRQGDNYHVGMPSARWGGLDEAGEPVEERSAC
jgi:hypothetical protein